MRGRARASAAVRHGVLIAWTVIVLGPVAWMVMTSFKDAGDWVGWPTRWVPFADFAPTLSNYRQILSSGGSAGTGALRREQAEQVSIWKSAFDSAAIATTASVVSLLLGSALAYAISRFGAGGKNYPYTILPVRLAPPIVVAIPIFIYYAGIPGFSAWLIGTRVEFLDTYYGLTLLYATTALPYVIWMMLAFLDGVPRELERAARSMGASRLATVRLVVFPLVASGMIATLLFVFILNWSEFLLALTLAQPKVLTLPVLLGKLQSAVPGRLDGPQAAIGTVVTIPAVVFGLLIQRHLVKGFSFGMIRR